MEKWMPVLFLALIFILLYSKGLHRKVLIAALILGAIVGIQGGMTGQGFVFSFISSTLLFYDAIYGIILIRAKYRRKREGKQ